MSDKPIVRMKNISKIFPGVRALSNISVDFYPGEVHVIIGENGAGKSTLIKILSGVYSLDEGSMEYKGENTRFKNPQEALDAGIAVIHQELSVVPDLTVAENIFLGREPRKGLLIDQKAMNREAQEILDDLGVRIRAKSKIHRLSTAERQMVEIAKVISRKASVVIMDEPTSSLAENEVQILFGVIRRLRENGVAILYISHRLKELYEIGDRITVLRDGNLVTTGDIGEIEEAKLVPLMVGREITNYFNKEYHGSDEVVFQAERLTIQGSFQEISFQVYRGEILGISGLIGSGRTELLRAIFGADRLDAGSMTLHGAPYAPKAPGGAISKHVGLVPEDRRNQGILLEDSVKKNIALPSIKRTSKMKNLVIDKKWEQRAAEEYKDSIHIKTPSVSSVCKTLSGGNQQKVVLAKWFAAGTELLLLDEPTRGIDVNAKSEIYTLINQFTEKGGSVIIVSSELPEILGITDRVLVMRNGAVKGELMTKDATEENIMALASYD